MWQSRIAHSRVERTLVSARGMSDLQSQSNGHPSLNNLPAKELDHDRFSRCELRVLNQSRRHHRIIITVERNRECIGSRPTKASDYVRANASLHSGNFDLMTSGQRCGTALHKVEVAQSVKFVVVGNAWGAAAEAYLGTDVQVYRRPTVRRFALKCLALPPLVHRKRPFALNPNGAVRHSHCVDGILQPRHNTKGQRGRPAQSDASDQCCHAFHRITSVGGSVRQAGDRSRWSGNFENVETGAGTIDYINVTPLIGFDIVALDGDLADVFAIDLDTTLIGGFGNRWNKIANFLRVIRVADIDGANTGIEPGHESKLPEENRSHALIGRM